MNFLLAYSSFIYFLIRCICYFFDKLVVILVLGRVTMPFGLVSAWNKRRRSKSEDQINPCMCCSASTCNLYLMWLALFIRIFIMGELKTVLSGLYKPVEYWQLEDQTMPAKRRQCSSVFTLKQMEEATRSFSEENFLGKGGFGRVYKGVLRSGEVKLRHLCTLSRPHKHLLNNQ